jgi:hypothetical protein
MISKQVFSMERKEYTQKECNVGCNECCDKVMKKDEHIGARTDEQTVQSITLANSRKTGTQEHSLVNMEGK